MDVKSWAGVLLGGVSLLGAGYLCRKFSNYYLNQVPQFRDFERLRDYLSNEKEERDVIVEGLVGKAHGNALISKETNLEGAARRVTITTYPVKEGKETSEKKESIEFSLFDFQGYRHRILVKSVEYATGFRQLLQKVHETRSVDRSDNMTLTEEYLLLFGTPLAGYGKACLERFMVTKIESGIPRNALKHRFVFTPYEVGTNIEKLSYPNKTTGNTLKFFSAILIGAGVGVIIISGISLIALLVKSYQQRHKAESKNPTANPT